MSVKNDVLKYLEANRNVYISGETLAKELNVSRSAVCKVVNTLKKDGYEIYGVTNKGYCLTGRNDILSVEGILPYLKHVNRKKLHVFDKLESTNKTAKELALNGAENGTVVIANSQTNGRGRLGRSFYSPADSGIYMSINLRPDTDAGNYSVITVAVCVAVCKAIFNLTGIDVRIKWVNDIYLEGKKICGILTEGITDIESGMISCVIVGIGININTYDFPDDIREIAGSLIDVNKYKLGTFSRNRFCAEIINNVLELTSSDNLKNRIFINEYRNKSVVIGKDIIVHIGDRRYSATVLDIDNDGRLIIKNQNGNIEQLSYGEISILFKE